MNIWDYWLAGYASGNGAVMSFLETHIIGDPTYHFANTVDPALDMNRAIVVSKKDNAMWYKLLNYPNADVQCMALRKLYENHAPGLPELLQKTYEASFVRSSSYGVYEVVVSDE